MMSPCVCKYVVRCHDNLVASDRSWHISVTHTCMYQWIGCSYCGTRTRASSILTWYLCIWQQYSVQLRVLSVTPVAFVQRLSYLRGCAAVRAAGQFIVLSCLSTDIWNHSEHNLFSFTQKFKCDFRRAVGVAYRLFFSQFVNFFCVSICMCRLSSVFMFQPLLTYSVHCVLHRFVSTALNENMCGISGFIAGILYESDMLLTSCF